MSNGNGNGNGNGVGLFRPTGTLVDVLVRYYGPLAFGAILVIVMKLVVFDPWLKENRIDWAEQRGIAKTLESTAASIMEATKTSNDTAKILERVVNEMNKGRQP